MLDSKDTQFTLSADGKILWQEKLNNPLPGVEIATLVKGDHPLRPVIEVLDNVSTAAQDKDRLRNVLSLWLNGYFAKVLEPLMLLGVPSTADAAEVSSIAARVYDGLGIIQRSEIEDLIAGLDTEKRTQIRAKKIRLGPILVFIPALTKPAAVRLRALLWSIYQGQALPPSVPADGIVSVKIEDVNANEDYYRAIGYPLYGGRAIRIDMLDRVISSIYDGAKDGKFQAKHQMAEWLGSTIEDLYKILEAMGHRKIHDPATEEGKVENSSAADAGEEASVPEVKVEAVATPADITEAGQSAEGEAKEPAPAQVKAPVLATFQLKRGKAFTKAKPSFQKNRNNADAQYKKKKEGEDKGTPAENRKKHKRPDHKKNKDNNQPRVISIEAKRKDDSPFAILQQLKTKSEG